MIEFIQNYGIWIALLGVFVAMQWFGMGCCGGHRKKQAQRTEGVSGDGAKESKTPDATQKSSGSCH